MNKEPSNEQHMLFCDGSSLGNPGPGGWGAVIVLRKEYIVELGARKDPTTNNEMELTALADGLAAMAHESGDLTVYTDSSYVINGATKWVYGWEQNGWQTKAKKPVEHQALWKKVAEEVRKRKRVGMLTWKHVPGHVGIAGNERVDEIAVGFAEGKHPELFEGELERYAIDIMNIDIDEVALAKRSEQKSRSRAQAYSYLSMVDGVIMRHLTWAECEKRVKGKSGVKFKKTLSPDEEEKIKREWVKK